MIGYLFENLPDLLTNSAPRDHHRKTREEGIDGAPNTTTAPDPPRRRVPVTSTICGFLRRREEIHSIMRFADPFLSTADVLGQLRTG